MRVQVITLFPEMFTGVLGSSMLWKAADRDIVQYEFINLRDFGLGPRQQVDDTPYGGGDGMLLKPEPLVAAIEYAKNRVTSPPAERAGHESRSSCRRPEGRCTSSPMPSGWRQR